MKKIQGAAQTKLISAADVALLAGVNQNTIGRWSKKGLLTPIRIVAPGNKRRVTRYRIDEVNYVLSGGRDDKK